MGHDTAAFSPPSHISGFVYPGASQQLKLNHLTVSQSKNLLSHLLFTGPVPRRPIKTTPQLARVKVSNFVSKIEVENPSGFLPTCSFPVGLCFLSHKAKKFTLLKWVRLTTDILRCTVQYITMSGMCRSITVQRGRYYSMSATCNLHDTCPQFAQSWRLGQAFI